jgi:hypothetical protein
MWENLYKSLKVQKLSKGYVRKRVPEDSIAAFQKAHGIQLPAAYLDFLQVLGPGYIADYFNIYAPGGDLEEKMARYKKNQKNLRDAFENAASLPRLVVFSDTLGGDLIAWDPQDISDLSASEYGIYALPRNDDKISKIAKTFPDFINSVCFGSGFDAISGGSGAERPREFEPHVEAG